MIHTVGSGTHIESVGICQKGFGSKVVNSINQMTQMSGGNVSGVAFLSEVQLDGNQVSFLDDFIKTSSIQQPVKLHVKIFLQRSAQIHGKYLTRHQFLLFLKLSKIRNPCPPSQA
jgi:hypothetical protein